MFEFPVRKLAAAYQCNFDCGQLAWRFVFQVAQSWHYEDYAGHGGRYWVARQAEDVFGGLVEGAGGECCRLSGGRKIFVDISIFFLSSKTN